MLDKSLSHMEHEEILEKLTSLLNQKYSLHIDNIQYPIQVTSFSKSKVPVRKPTTRGGVYFTDTTAFKIKARTDLSIKNQIPRLMLGPNADFKPILIKTLQNDMQITLTTHLTNAVSSKDGIELNLIVDKVSVN
jgi:hypothetical protein